MEPWWERWPDRLPQERAAFEAYGFEMELDDEAFAAGRVMFRGRCAMRGQVLDLLIEYPDDYPATRFRASTDTVRVPRHQSPGGSLCLLGRSSDQWDRTWTAAEVIATQLPDVLDTVHATAEAMAAIEDPQGEPYSTYFAYADSGSILVPDDLRLAASGRSSGSITVRMLNPGNWPAVEGDDHPVGQGTLIDLTDEQGRQTHTDSVLVDRCEGDTWRGNWARLDRAPDALSNHADLVNDLVRDGLHLDFKAHGTSGYERAIVGIVFTEEVGQGSYDDTWIFLAITRPKSSRNGGPSRNRGPRPDPNRGRIVRLIRGLRTGPDTHGERIPELAALRDMTVVLLGAGTLGAPIARELAKAQLGELIIVEPDFADAGPIVRWDLGMRSVGMSKGRALQADLKADYPYTNTTVVSLSVGNTFAGRGPGTKDRLEAALYGADLIIDATAEWNIREVVAAYATEATLPVITVWSIEGYGGVVSIARPGDDACCYCRELWLSPETGAVDLPTGPADPTRIQPTGCADATFTAASPDLRPLANQAVTVAFGILTAGQSPGYPPSSYDLYVHWHRQPDGSLHDPPFWTTESLPRHDGCPCHDDT